MGRGLIFLFIFYRFEFLAAFFFLVRQNFWKNFKNRQKYSKKSSRKTQWEEERDFVSIPTSADVT